MRVNRLGTLVETRLEQALTLDVPWKGVAIHVSPEPGGFDALLWVGRVRLDGGRELQAPVSLGVDELRNQVTEDQVGTLIDAKVKQTRKQLVDFYMQESLGVK